MARQPAAVRRVEIAATGSPPCRSAARAAAGSSSAHGIERLAPGVVTPALNAANVHDERALAAALDGVLTRSASRRRRIALVIPDTAAKVSLLRFEKVPPKLQDLDQLIRWQVRKAAPFRIEDAQVSWQAAVRAPRRRARVPGHGRRAATSSRATNGRATPPASTRARRSRQLNLINAVLASRAHDAETG